LASSGAISSRSDGREQKEKNSVKVDLAQVECV